MNASAGREILFEMTRIGNLMRVVAIDTATGAEAVIQGPANTSSAELKRVAAAKLEFLLNKGSQK